MSDSRSRCLTTKQVVAELKAAKADLIPFIGAGFTCNISPNATYHKLITGCLSKRLKISAGFFDQVFARDVARFNDFAIWSLGSNGSRNAATKYSITRGKTEYAKLVREWLEQCDLLSGEVDTKSWLQHIWLVRNFPRIYTTNWDTALERACEYCDDTCLRVKGEAIWPDKGRRTTRSTPPIGNGTTTIIKLHGDIHKPQSIVASETDYYQRLTKAEIHSSFEMRHLIPDLVSNRRLLFLGYSLADVNIRYILKGIIELLRSGHKADSLPPSYLVSVDSIRPAHMKRVSEYYLDNWNMRVIWIVSGKSRGDRSRIIREQVLKFLETLTD